MVANIAVDLPKSQSHNQSRSRMADWTSFLAKYLRELGQIARAFASWTEAITRVLYLALGY